MNNKSGKNNANFNSFNFNKSSGIDINSKPYSIET